MTVLSVGRSLFVVGGLNGTRIIRFAHAVIEAGEIAQEKQSGAESTNPKWGWVGSEPPAPLITFVCLLIAEMRMQTDVENLFAM